MSVRVPHPNDMSAWAEIACQRGHQGHRSILTRVDLTRPHAYADLTPIPPEVARRFEMRVFDWQTYAGDGPYCPGNDAVSQTIVETGIWEPRETAMALTVMDEHEGEALIDFGAQLGWFCLLAASCGLRSFAFDADPEPLRLLRSSAELNGWTDLVGAQEVVVGPQVEAVDLPDRARLAKLDLEGAEDEAVRLLWPMLDRGAIDHLVMEVSPCFAPWYPELCDEIMADGYELYRMPDKQVPPIDVKDPAFLERVADVSWIGHQDTVWFRREDAEW
jgi:hypothetical protein